LEEENGVKRKKGEEVQVSVKKKSEGVLLCISVKRKFTNVFSFEFSSQGPGEKSQAPPTFPYPLFPSKHQMGRGFHSPPLFSSGFLLKTNKPSILVSTLLEILWLMRFKPNVGQYI
jgi:hypothetical protein